MLAKIFTLALKGIDGFIVSAEVYIASGLPAYAIVGLPDAAVMSVAADNSGVRLLK